MHFKVDNLILSAMHGALLSGITDPEITAQHHDYVSEAS